MKLINGYLKIPSNYNIDDVCKYLSEIKTFVFKDVPLNPNDLIIESNKDLKINIGYLSAIAI